MRSFVAISSSRKSLARSKNVPLSRILTGREDELENKTLTKSGTKVGRDISLILGTVPENPGQMITLFYRHWYHLGGRGGLIDEMS